MKMRMMMMMCLYKIKNKVKEFWASSNIVTMFNNVSSMGIIQDLLEQYKWVKTLLFLMP